MTSARTIALCCAALLIAACGSDEAASPAAPATPVPDLANVDWSTYLGDEGRSHFSPLTQVNRDKVPQLELAWSYDSGEKSGTMYTSPVVRDGRLCALSPKLHAFALNAATGEELWRYDPELPGGAQRGLDVVG